ncbi:MAG: hypothetical protein HYZ73_02640 [Elusimicrobia bacterium]|nr:hypothetical protein [Elusimicrobiota bacterium]
MLLLPLVMTMCLLFDSAQGVAMGTSRAYESEIRMRAQQIKGDDGVDKEEAIILAQNQVLKDEQEKIFDLKSAEIFGENDAFWDKGTWHVSFKVKSREWLSRGIKWCTLHVNKKTGEVTSGGCGPS